MSRQRRPAARLAIPLAVAAVVIVLDQVTKSIAVAALSDGPTHLFWTLDLDLSFNSGAAFSMGTGLTPYITVAVVILAGGLLVLSHRVDHTPTAASLGLVLGGALGNLSDRLLRGHGGAVVDFIDFEWWPVFNVADIAISVGAVLLVLMSFRREPSERVDA